MTTTETFEATAAEIAATLYQRSECTPTEALAAAVQYLTEQMAATRPELLGKLVNAYQN